ncbi:MAG: tetratricopeptide repeat protein [Magnetococcales bacterium]|nr:tetratricopeptide repeat protein [Magnetococcales bacterium]
MICLTCPHCHFDNGEDARFCTRCGTALFWFCLHCYTRAQEGDLFCRGCGKPLTELVCPVASGTQQPTPDMGSERKYVTVLFADISGFTAISETMDAEDVTDLMNGCMKMLADVVIRYDGYVDKFIGDCIMAIFGAPVAHENDPELAVRVALEMNREINEYNKRLPVKLEQPLSLHIGINSGMVIAGGVGCDQKMEYTVMGDTVNLASRLESIAGNGQIFVSIYTYNMVRHLFDFIPHEPIKVKGKKKPVAVYEVTKVKSRESGEAAPSIGLTVPLVGRTQETESLMACIDRLLVRNQGQAVFLVADPGIGKSRMQMEIAATLKEKSLSVLSGACRSFSRSTSYSVFVGICHPLFDIESEDVPERMADKLAAHIPLLAHVPATPLSDETRDAIVFIGVALGLQMGEQYDVLLEQMSAQEIKMATFRAFAWFFRKIALHRPLVLIFEDLHYADTTSIELIEYLFDVVAEVPMLMLMLMRPAPGHPSHRLPPIAQRLLNDRASEIHIRRLSDADTDRMVSYLFRTTEQVPEELLQLVRLRSDGNPMYIEETVRSLVEDAVVLTDDKGSINIVKDLECVTIPDSLQGMIIARIDRLSSDLKDLLHTMVVIGPTLSQPLIQRLFPQPGMEVRIDRLIELGIIFEARSFPEVEYSFRNVLVQEAIYATILNKRLKEIHLQVAESMEALYQQRLDDHCEVLAYHYYRAGQWQRAFSWLVRSGFKARNSYANSDAVNYFTQAIDLAPRLEQLPEPLEKIYLVLSEVQEFSGDLPAAIVSLQQAIRLTTNVVQQADTMRNIGRIHEKSGAIEQALAVYQQAETLLADVPDSIEMGMLLTNRSWILNRMGESQQAIQDANRAQDIFELHGDWERIAHVSNNLAVILEHQGRLLEALEHGRKSLQIFSDLGNHRQMANLYLSLGFLHDKMKCPADALNYFDRSYEIMQRIGNPYGAGTALMCRGRSQLRAGQLDQAETTLLEAINIHRKLNLKRKLVANEWLIIELCLRRNDTRRAREHLVQAQQLSSSSESDQAHTLFWEAQLLMEEGDNPDQAMRQFMAAVAAFEALDLPREAAEVRTMMERYGLVASALAGAAPSSDDKAPGGSA